jgi:methylenetetrahydrofolate reductase (NADPH)
MGIGVGGFPEGHPETPNRLKEMEYLKAKVDAGADYICTQLFFDNHDFYDFRERCRIYGIDVPVIPGIMPVTSEKNMERMSDLALGTRYPAGLLKSLKKAGSHGEHFRRAGLHWATEQVKDLLRRGVPGIHFYTLNKSEDVLEITKSTGIYSSKTV